MFPAVGHNVTRTAYSSNYDGSCDYDTFTIQIKGCQGYLVYYLKPVSGCTSAYCFGKYSEGSISLNCMFQKKTMYQPFIFLLSSVERLNTLMVWQWHATRYKEEEIIKKRGWNLFNRFNPATIFVRSISIGMFIISTYCVPSR